MVTVFAVRMVGVFINFVWDRCVVYVRYGFEKRRGDGVHVRAYVQPCMFLCVLWAA